MTSTKKKGPSPAPSATESPKMANIASIDEAPSSPEAAPSEDLQERVTAAGEDLRALVDSLNQVLLGKEALIRRVSAGLLAGGHILLEGMPGLGKTELVKGLARLCDVRYARVQFTPDLLPGDITGSYILEETDGKREFAFREGPIFANIVLADEINRASPKTQSALLEAMQEGSATVMGKTFQLPRPFFVMATQNPVDLEGTYPLPEAQVDRFMMKLYLERPAPDVVATILRERDRGRPPELKSVLTHKRLEELIALGREIYLSRAVAEFIARLVEATQPDSPSAPESVRRYARFGASPRAAIALAGAVRAAALLDGNPQAGFQAARDFFPSVANHRLLLDYSAKLDGVSADDLIRDILDSVGEVARPLPAGVKTA
jgi:MoxR-like ATPase